jgi:hypothetical protein
MHASIVLTHEITEYASLFAEIADAYFDKEMYVDARPVYEALGSDASVSCDIYGIEEYTLNCMFRPVACTC